MISIYNCGISTKVKFRRIAKEQKQRERSAIAVNWDLERMIKAVNAVPYNIKTSKDFDEWINNLTDDDFT